MSLYTRKGPNILGRYLSKTIITTTLYKSLHFKWVLTAGDENIFQTKGHREAKARGGQGTGL